MMKRIVLLLAFSLGACVQNPDIGKTCSTSACGVNAPPDNANTVCEPTSECGTLLCVAQGSGLGTGASTQFCTASCEEESDCPDNLSCQEIAEVGKNANRKMCLLVTE